MNVKKLISMVLALVMLLAMSATAMAADKTYTITIENEVAGHTYEAYQIFSGTLLVDDEDPKNVKSYLGNIVWGTGVDQNKLTDAEKADAAAVAKGVNDSNAVAFAADMAKKLSTTYAESTYDDEVTPKVYKISNLKPGYYLVKDKEKSLNDKDDAYTSFILVVVKDETVSPKSDVPEFVKKVDDENDSIRDDGDDKTTADSGNEDGTDWQDSADHDIDDEIPFLLKATLPENYSAYTSYKLVFHDEMSTGLTFNPESVKVYVDDTLINAGYEVKTTNLEHSACTFEVVFANLKEVTENEDGTKTPVIPGLKDSSVIRVEYTATLNSGAVHGSAGNPNTAYLEFSNNPNYDGTGDEPTGKTPVDKVIVFTYKVIVNKVDPDKNPLDGAEFTLSKKLADGSWKTLTKVTGTAGTTFEWKGLDDGDYKLEETKAPDGYNKVNDILFTITATHDITSDNPALTGLSGSVASGEVTFTADTAAGSLTTSVVNQKGATLPSTGAQGTKMLYIVGGILVAAAAVLLIVKRRMDSAE